MTPAARIAAAIDLLDQIFAGQSAEQALTRWARGARFAGSKDRAAIRDHVFQALRCRRSYAALGGGGSGMQVMLGALRAEDVDPATIFTGEGHAPQPLSPEEISAGSDPQSDAERADLPDWLWSVFQEDLGADAPGAAMAQRSRGPITLRVNERLKSAPQTIEILIKDGIEIEQDKSVETALHVVSGERRIRGGEAYRNGWVELQDASSQAAMARISVPGGARVLDYCAGGGGKTLALAARQDALWFAHDAEPRRMSDLPERAERAGVSICRLTTQEARSDAPFDVVLCDVPCSGSGTWRRGPEAKWRLTPDRLSELLDIQATILDEACRLVAPGGQLIYTTCSVLCRENRAQVEAFAARQPGWAVADQCRWSVDPWHDGFYMAQLNKL